MASAIAVGTIRNIVEEQLRARQPAKSASFCTEALEEANRKILEYQAANIEVARHGLDRRRRADRAARGEPWHGSATAALTSAIRAALRQMPKDHSLVQRLIEIGQITAEEARHHEHKNVITRSLGARQSGPGRSRGV